MSDRCSIMNPVNASRELKRDTKRKEFSSRLAEAMVDLSRLYQFTKSSDSMKDFNISDDDNDNNVFKGASDMYKAMTGERAPNSLKDLSESISKLDKTRRDLFFRAVQKQARQFYSAMENPWEVVDELHDTGIVLNAFKHQRALEKAGTGLDQLYMRILKSVGLVDLDRYNKDDIKSGRKFDFIGEKFRSIKAYEPAAKVFTLFESTVSLTQNTSTNAHAEMAKAVSQVHNDTKAYGLDTLNKVNTFITLLDKDIASKYEGVNLQQKIVSMGVHKFNMEISEDESSVIERSLNSFNKKWKALNYGNLSSEEIAKVNDALDSGDKEEITKWLDRTNKGSISRMFLSLRLVADEMDTLLSSVSDRVSAHEREILYTLIGSLKGFRLRDEYLPVFNKDREDMSHFVGLKENSTLPITSWLKSRGLFNENTELNFFNSFNNNLLGTTMLMQNAMSRFMATYLPAKVEEDHKWFNSSTDRKVFRRRILEVADIAERDVSYEAGSEWINRGRNFVTNTVSLVATAILAYPGSAIRNILMNNLALYAKLGHELGRKDFSQALLSGNDSSAHKIQSLVNEKFVGGGLAEEFVTYHKEGLSFLESIDSKINTITNKIADFQSEGMGMGKMLKVWHDNLTMPGTETRSRAMLSNLVYNRLQNEIELKGANNVDVDSFIKQEIERGWLDINSALGNYSKYSKPFLTHALLSDSNTHGEVIIGGVLKYMSLFRHSAVVAASNFQEAFADKIFLESNPEMSGFKSSQVTAMGAGALFVGLGMLLHEVLKSTVFSNVEEYPKFGTSLSTALNPFTEYVAPAKLSAWLMMGAFNNMFMTEAEYGIVEREFLSISEKDLEGMGGDLRRSFLGMFAGNTPGNPFVNRGDFRPSDDDSAVMSELKGMINNVLDLKTDMMSLVKGNTSYATGKTALSELRTESMRKDSSIFDLLHFDPIHFLRFVNEFITASAPNSPGASGKYRTELGLRFLQSAFAFNFWIKDNSSPYQMAFTQPIFDSRAMELAVASHRDGMEAGNVLLGHMIRDSYMYQGVVKRILDGDTVLADIGGREEKIRLFGIDAPELSSEFIQTFGDVSGDMLRRVLQDSDNNIKVNYMGRDMYGRWIGRLFANINGVETDLSSLLVESGVAKVTTRYGYVKEDVSLQNQARKAGLGIHNPEVSNLEKYRS